MNKHILLAATALLLISTAAAHAQDGYSTYTPGTGANYETRLVNQEDQLRALTGKLEQLEYAVRRLDQTLQRMQSDYEQRITKIETAPPPTPVVQQAPTVATTTNINRPSTAAVEPVVAETTASGRLGDLKVQGNRVVGGEVNPKASPLPAKPEDYGLTAQELYDKAFGLLRQANYEEAERAFKAFVDKYPKDKLIDNAKYWYGETFYVRAKFNEAAVTFADAYQTNPKGTKAPDSLLKLGMALGSLGKTEDACATLLALKKEYPNAPVALRSRADQERARQKCTK